MGFSMKRKQAIKQDLKDSIDPKTSSLELKIQVTDFENLDTANLDTADLDTVDLDTSDLDTSDLDTVDLQNAKKTGTLWVIAVPIGNLEDITLRALRILKAVPMIACEDTRTTKQLLQLLGIKAPKLIAYHEHNEGAQSKQLCQYLLSGQDLALVSDAGTPTLSDPGFRLVKLAGEMGIKVTPLPGACAIITALCASGLPTSQFEFLGFLSAKDGARRKQLEQYKENTNTMIFYESPHRLLDFLKDACDVFSKDREAVIARELTKKFEEFRRAKLGELLENPGVVRGEIVVLIAGADKQDQEVSQKDIQVLARHALAQGMTPSYAAKWLSREGNITRKEAYDVIISVVDHKPKSI